jgi:hypothetical protein
MNNTSGSSDGLIRVVALQPNKILGVIGDHEGDNPFHQTSLTV